MCINFSSLMYWPPGDQPTALIAAATFSMVSMANGNTSLFRSQASLAMAITCSLFVFCEALEDLAMKPSLSSRLACANFSLPFRMSMTSSNEPFLVAPICNSPAPLTRSVAPDGCESRLGSCSSPKWLASLCIRF